MTVVVVFTQEKVSFWCVCSTTRGVLPVMSSRTRVMVVVCSPTRKVMVVVCSPTQGVLVMVLVSNKRIDGSGLFITSGAMIVVFSRIPVEVVVFSRREEPLW